MSNPYAPPSSDRRSGRRTDGPRTDGPRTGDQRADGPHTDDPHTGGRPDPRAGRPGARRPPDAEAVQLASRRVMHFGVAMLATLVTATLPLPWQAAGLAFAVVAIVLGVRALRTVWLSGVRGTLVPVLAVGLVFAALMTVSLGTMLALWPLQIQRQDCLRDALTITATEACETQFQDGLTQRLDQMGQRSGD